MILGKFLFYVLLDSLDKTKTERSSIVCCLLVSGALPARGWLPAWSGCSPSGRLCPPRPHPCACREAPGPLGVTHQTQKRLQGFWLF